MTLNEIIKTEEKLLKIDDKFKDSLSFNEAVRLKRYLTVVGDITNVYFELIENHHRITKSDISASDKVNEIYSYNESLLNSEVDNDILNINEITGFINIVSDKYDIVFNEETDEDKE